MPVFPQAVRCRVSCRVTVARRRCVAHLGPCIQSFRKRAMARTPRLGMDGRCGGGGSLLVGLLPGIEFHLDAVLDYATTHILNPQGKLAPASSGPKQARLLWVGSSSSQACNTASKCFASWCSCAHLGGCQGFRLIPMRLLETRCFFIIARTTALFEYRS